jgi:hypothetical protein
MSTLLTGNIVKLQLIGAGDLLESAKQSLGKSDNTNPGGAWCRDSKLDTSAPVEAHVQSLISFLETKNDIVKEFGAGCSFELSIGFTSRGWLSAGLLNRIHSLSVPVSLNFYRVQTPLDKWQ